MIDDAELLRRYAEEGSESSFAELVQRHVDLVYSVAVRQVGGDVHLAKDVVQKVFAAVARKAATLIDRATLAGWLYRSAQFEASKLVRSEQRRRARERRAVSAEDFMQTSEPEPDWRKLRPVLDEALAELGERDRDALILRFLEGRALAEVGERLSLTENAARMRVDRALEKLHGLLARRGVTSTTSALVMAVAGQAAVAAPTGLAVSVTTAALGEVAALGTGAMIFMGVTKLNLSLVGVIVVAGSTGWFLQQHSAAETDRARSDYERQVREVADVRTENRMLERNVNEARAFEVDDAELVRLRTELNALLQKTSSRLGANAAAVRTGSVNETVYDSNSLDVQPKPTFQSAPEYPAELRRSGTAGQALVSFVVQADGLPREVQVIEASLPEFGRAAQAAVSKWKFAPGQKGGAAVNTLMKIPIVFSLSTEKTSPPADWF